MKSHLAKDYWNNIAFFISKDENLTKAHIRYIEGRLMGKRNSAVLVSEEDWSAIQETLYLLSVPGMRESIREGMEAPVDDCHEELDRVLDDQRRV